MSREVWGTYSVRDHLARSAFLADLMFYDRLVLPVPKPGEEDKWEKWNPARQSAFIKVLETAGRVRTVPWEIGTWDRAKAAGQAGPDAFLFTRTRLTHDLPKNIRGVTVYPTYGDSEEFVQDFTRAPVKKESSAHGGHSIAALTLEFLAPQIDGPVEPEHLEPILEYTSTREHKKARDAFWRWQRDFFGDDVITDQSSIDAAVAEMEDLRTELRDAVRWKGIKTCSQYLFLAGSVSIAMMGGPLTMAAVGGIALSVGQFAIDKAADGKQKEPVSPAALFVHDKRSLPFRGT